MNIATFVDDTQITFIDDDPFEFIDLELPSGILISVEPRIFLAPVTERFIRIEP